MHAGLIDNVDHVFFEVLVSRMTFELDLNIHVVFFREL